MISFFQRLKSKGAQARPELPSLQRTVMWSTVSDNDNCLKCVLDILDDFIEGNAGMACHPENDEAKRLLAATRMGVARDIMGVIEREREDAKKWKEQQGAK